MPVREGPVPGGRDDPPITKLFTLKAAALAVTERAFHLLCNIKRGFAPDAVGYEVEFAQDITPIFLRMSLAASRSFCVSPFPRSSFEGGAAGRM